MSFFTHLHKNAGKGSEPIKAQNLQIRREVVKPVKKPDISKATPPAPPINRFSVTPNRSVSANAGKNGVPSKPQPVSKAVRPPSNGRRKPSVPAPPVFSSSSDDSSSPESPEGPRKRPRRGSIYELDPKRIVCDRKAFSEEDNGVFHMVHAADIASLDQSNKFIAAFPESAESLDLILQYPNASQQERYKLVIPKDREDFKSLEDIIQTIEHVTTYCLPQTESRAFTDESTGFIRRLRRAISRQHEKEFRDIVAEYNNAVIKLRKDGKIAEHLDKSHRLALPLIKCILDQIYSRTVSLRVATLRKYENGTDNVYGELLPRFISKIFKDTQLKSDHLFIDLGSGVGNVVLQAALEIGCESWGCEMMDAPCDLAELQEAEFKARCRLWGLATGSMHLERGDFLSNPQIRKMLPKADVLLVNNQAFTPGLNDSLLHLFLDLKEGCQIVSLKSFVPSGHKLTKRNMGSPVNLLQVQEKPYFSASVSWTDAAGTYCVARKDSSKLRRFEESLS